ncbi:hypothetical protein I317_05955 [Kwoniella heveanensis CBS 569]|uniref:TMEM205-like domain-containing protein n=1 Tax=Kwoniella heveanensis BCC8398 TaxID=1296120 RepID=A0A1B9GK72_9TREE|nr:hypothetical protein I316_07002 [Kwoniella heveanensis BCC8398]OCF40261.1 hypothetical protein I317_05955 [Kwoniella heveanensis CBS 569]
MAVFQSALAPFTLKGFYLITWGTALGANVWNTISGFRTYKTLPRQTFGTLQSRLTPLYFTFSTLSTATLLLTHLYFHPGLISSPRVEPHWATSEAGHQGFLILAALIPQVLNLLVVGPWTSEVMFQRHRQERVESKEYDEAGVSEEMEKINKKFSILHGIGSALNTVSFLGLAGLGLAVSM